ncbi:MAG: hypothetical protein H0U44_10195 [Flavisolibacter sp.]|nr:hypothetical protein [Flavisolibacter sp.]
MKRWLSLIFALIFFSTILEAQNLNGYWKGTLTMTGGCFPVNHIELQIKIKGNEVWGDSYHYLDVNNYVKKDFRGSYDPETKKLIVQEGLVTTFKIRPDCQVCIKRYELTYSTNGTQEILTGGWTGHIMNSRIRCQDGSIVLSRIKESVFREIPEIAVDTGQLRLDFYDNAEVDGDSITVRVNGQTILTHQRLSTKPITAFVTIDQNNPFQEVEMVAENLGSIPPNTAILIVTAGKDRYQLFLSSTEEKSARVRFVYDPDRRGRMNSER